MFIIPTLNSRGILSKFIFVLQLLLAELCAETSHFLFASPGIHNGSLYGSYTNHVLENRHLAILIVLGRVGEVSMWALFMRM